MSSSISRRRMVTWTGASPFLLAGACASKRAASPEVTAALAPTGRLRASINLGNPILARRDPAGGEALGVSVDLSRRLADELGVGLVVLTFDSAAKSVEAVKGGQADIGFFAIDPMRSDGIRFTAPYVLIEGAYLVRQASPLTGNAEVDRPGTRIMVGRGSAYDLFLSRELKAAQLMRAPTSPKVVDEFFAAGADVAAGVKQQLEADAARLPGLRLLPGRFMVIEQAMGLPASRSEDAARYLAGFVESAKSSGYVAEALQRHNIQGAAVAPAA
jgi:polar amino acid transport system substrate-binding protein